MGKNDNPLEPVPRYEFADSQRNLIAAKDAADKLLATQTKRIDDVYIILNRDYYTKEGVRDQFKIELSDYKIMKIILGAVATAVLGLIVALILQFVINTGAR